MKDLSTANKIQELIFEGITEGYDVSCLDDIQEDVLLFFYDIQKFRNWEGLFSKNDPSKITKEDVVNAILKTDHVSGNKIQCIEWCIEKGLTIKPLLETNYDEASLYAIYCGICAGVNEAEFENNGEVLSLEAIHKITKSYKSKDIIIR